MARPRGRPPKVISTSPDTTSKDEPPAKRKQETPSKPVQKKKKPTVEESPAPIVNGHTSTPSSEVVSAKLSAQEQTGSIRLNTKVGGGTPKAGSKVKKTYAFNFELDVSIDADVIVNVRRKKKAPTESPALESIEPSPATRRKSPSKSPSPAVLPKRSLRQNASIQEENSIISLNTTEGDQSSVHPDDDTIPNSDPNTPEPRYLASRSIVSTPQRKVAAAVGRSNARLGEAPARAGEYKGKKAKS